LNERQAEWQALRDALMEYANQHPSDRVRQLGHDVEQAVWADLRSTAFLLRARRGETTTESFHASEQAHADALAKTERLMAEVRRY
jgi:hypothetical protein